VDLLVRGQRGGQVEERKAGGEHAQSADGDFHGRGLSLGRKWEDGIGLGIDNPKLDR
jgi:hypothetical protein